MKPLTRSDTRNSTKYVRSGGGTRLGGRLCLQAFLAFLMLAAWSFLVPGRGNAQNAQSRRRAARAASTQEKKAASNSETTPPGDAARGKKLFASDGCYECHGYYGQGGGGPRLAPDPVPYAVVIGELRHPINAMPPYTSKVVSDKDVRDIYAFLQSVPKPPKVEDLPLLR